MPICEDELLDSAQPASASIELMQAEFLSDCTGIRHGFFTRRGGVSQGIFASLNCGFGSSDRREDVARNRARVSRELAVEPTHLITPNQIHSATAVVVSEPWDWSSPPPADAVVTATPGLAVAVLAADCTPVLLADPEARVVAAAHAGWKGARAGIVQAAIGAMEELGAERERIIAAIGPTISQASYEVGPEFMEAFVADSPAYASYFSHLPGKNRPHFDLPGFVKAKLFGEGVVTVEDLQCCTYQNESLCFSYRRSGHRGEPDYGRQISAIVIS